MGLWDYGTFEPWVFWTMQFWTIVVQDHSTSGPWESGTKGLWNHGTLGPWNFGTLGLGDPGTLGPFDFGGIGLCDHATL